VGAKFCGVIGGKYESIRVVVASIVFGLKRQDPFDNWDLYYSKFPADPPGNRTSNNFKTNFANNDC
jgi:hypothetical protein